MSEELTVEKLLELVTSKEPVIKTKRITKSEYAVRKGLLEKRLNHTLNILKANHWQKMSDFINSISSSKNHISFLSKFRKLDLGIADRLTDVIYDYVLDVYICNYYLRLIEYNVEDSIDYDMPIYEC